MLYLFIKNLYITLCILCFLFCLFCYFFCYFLIYVVVHGNWGAWSSWNRCDCTRQLAMKLRSRQCNNPAPSNGGNNCVGSPQESNACSQTDCPRMPGKDTYALQMRIWLYYIEDTASIYHSFISFCAQGCACYLIDWLVECLHHFKNQLKDDFLMVLIAIINP